MKRPTGKLIFAVGMLCLLAIQVFLTRRIYVPDDVVIAVAASYLLAIVFGLSLWLLARRIRGERIAGSPYFHVFVFTAISTGVVLQKYLERG